MSEKQQNTEHHSKRVATGRQHPDTKHPDPQLHEAGKQEEERQSRWPLLLTALLIGSIVGAYFVFPGFRQGVNEGWEVFLSGDEARISGWVSQFGFWGPVFIIAAMVAQMFLVVVNVTALMLVAILAYGPVWGSAIAVVAVLVASTVGYLIGKGIGEAGVSKIIGRKSQQKVASWMDRYGVWAIVIARISPFLSNDAVSLVAGLARMGYLRFMGATVAGIVPLTILLAWLGEDNNRLKSGLIWVSVISLAAFIGYLVYQKYRRPQ